MLPVLRRPPPSTSRGGGTRPSAAVLVQLRSASPAIAPGLTAFVGVLFVALGLAWPRLELGMAASRIAFWFLVYSSFVTIAAFGIAAVWGAGSSIMPLAAGGARGSDFQEAVNSAGHLPGSPSGHHLFRAHCGVFAARQARREQRNFQISAATALGRRCTNAGTEHEDMEKLVQHVASNISYLASSSLLPKLSVEGSIPFARSNVFKHLRHGSTLANCSWVRHGYAKRECECVSGARQRKRNSLQDVTVLKFGMTSSISLACSTSKRERGRQPSNSPRAEASLSREDASPDRQHRAFVS